MLSNILLLVIAAAAPPALARGYDEPTASLHRRQRALLGENYCVWGPDETCYETGWPACCGEDAGDSCPDNQPQCEINDFNNLPEYCQNQPDSSCYANGGVPACCLTGDVDGVGCPPEMPPCDITTTSTTTFTTTATITEAPQTPEPDTSPPPSSGQPLSGPSYCNPTDLFFDCYALGVPECCVEDPTNCPESTPPMCDTDMALTPSTVFNTDELPVGAFPPLTLPEGGLRKCNEIVPMDYPDDIIPKEVVLAILEGFVDALNLGDLTAVVKMQLPGLALYDIRARKVCTTCEDMNAVWEENNKCVDGEPCTSKAFASEVMPYCVEGSFASGRTMSGLLLEPIDPTTKEPIVGKVATTLYNFPTDPNPFNVPSEMLPYNPATSDPTMMGAMAVSSAGTYTLIPDVLGNGEDWGSTRSFMVKALYQASAIPLMLKVKDDVEKTYICTELDKRIAIVGFSEGGYAAVAVADAIDRLDDDYVHTYTGVGGAPLKTSSAQQRATVEMYEGTYIAPFFAGRLGNSFSSTNGDLVNTNLADTDIQQNFASEKFLDPYDQTKNAVEWAKAGLDSQEILALMTPTGPNERWSDMMNQDFVEMVVNSWNANNTDPCNSEFKTDSIDKLCEALIENDVYDIIQNIDYPVTICHSPNDDIIFYSNVPNVTMNDNLMMLEDTPLIGAILKPTGSHYESFFSCLMGFIVPYMSPVDTSDMKHIRSVLPIEDSDGVCNNDVTTATTTLATKPTSDGIAGTSTVASSGGVTNTSTTTASSISDDSKDSTAAISISDNPPTKSPTSSPTFELTSMAFSVSSLSVAMHLTAMYLATIVFGGFW